MQNVVLTIHLILAVLLTGVVLLQRSEGGGLGMGGGGGGAGGVMTGRQAANALTRLTWIFGIAIFVTSLGLTVIAARETANSSIMDQLGVPESQQAPEPSLPALPGYTPPPTTGGDPLTPPAPSAVTPPAAPEAASAAPDASADALTPPAAEAPAATESTPAEATPADTAPADEAAAADGTAAPVEPAPAN